MFLRWIYRKPPCWRAEVRREDVPCTPHRVLRKHPPEWHWGSFKDPHWIDWASVLGLQPWLIQTSKESKEVRMRYDLHLKQLDNCKPIGPWGLDPISTMIVTKIQAILVNSQSTSSSP